MSTPPSPDFVPFFRYSDLMFSGCVSLITSNWVQKSLGAELCRPLVQLKEIQFLSSSFSWESRQSTCPFSSIHRFSDSIRVDRPRHVLLFATDDDLSVKSIRCVLLCTSSRVGQGSRWGHRSASEDFVSGSTNLVQVKKHGIDWLVATIEDCSH